MHVRDRVCVRAGIQRVWSDGCKEVRGLRTWESGQYVVGGDVHVMCMCVG